MAFQVHHKNASKGAAPLTIPTIAVYSGRDTVLTLPRDVLSVAGLPTNPGAKFEVLIGEGDDAGCIAIRPSDAGFKSTVVNSKSGTAQLRFGRVGKVRYSAKPVTALRAVNGMLVMRLPADFPWTAQTPAPAFPPVSVRIEGVNGNWAA